MSGLRVLIIGSDYAAFCSVRHALEECARVFATVDTRAEILEMQESIRALESIANECEPLSFADYGDKYDDSDCKLELDDKPIHFNRKPVINYPKPIFKPRFVRRGNRGK